VSVRDTCHTLSAGHLVCTYRMSTYIYLLFLSQTSADYRASFEFVPEIYTPKMLIFAVVVFVNNLHDI
jgi:hypothetical protein